MDRVSNRITNKPKIHCTQPPHAEATKLLCPHHEGASAPHLIRVVGADQWYQTRMALVSAAGKDHYTIYSKSLLFLVKVMRASMKSRGN